MMKCVCVCVCFSSSLYTCGSVRNTSSPFVSHSEAPRPMEALFDLPWPPSVCQPADIYIYGNTPRAAERVRERWKDGPLGTGGTEEINLKSQD